MKRSAAAACVLVCSLFLQSTSVVAVDSGANPVRKVVDMLQSMQRKVMAEGEKEKSLYKKFMCYCKSGGSDLAASISSASSKLGDLSTDISTSEAKLAQVKSALEQAQKDRVDCNRAMEEATALREKEAGVYSKFKDEMDTNLAALTKAIASIDSGMAGGFLQTNPANTLRKFLPHAHLSDDDHRMLVSFLAGSDAYAPQSGQIAGILKELHDEMSEDLADTTQREKAAIQANKDLMSSRLKEKEALTSQIEAKLTKSGDLGVSIARMKNDAGDTGEAQAADQKLLAALKKGCATKTGEWEARSKTRTDELVALADTIKILNDDDALELFKKTIPSVSLVQVEVSSRTQRQRALQAIERGQRAAGIERTNLDFIALALHGKKQGFATIIAMIDKMTGALEKEQVDDDNKKAYCAAQLDEADDDHKRIQRDIGNLQNSIALGSDAITLLAEEIATLKSGIAELDKNVAEATANRKAENQEFVELIAMNSAAKEVLGKAKNRLHQFYNPKLAKTTPAPVELVETLSSSPPATWAAGYRTKSESNGGVVEMLNVLIADLDKDMTEGRTEETDAQADYEVLMKDSAEKRSADSKSLSEKESAKANTEAAAEGHTEDLAAATRELGGTKRYIANLHAECDWLEKYFDVRKQARADEMDSLKNAKAVLSGSDYALVQVKSSFLTRRV